MTEAEWLACDDPQEMLSVPQIALPGDVYRRELPPSIFRKDRLFAVACLRTLPNLSTGQLESIQILEQRAEALATKEQRQRACTLARRAIPENLGPVEHGDDPHYVALMVYRAMVSRRAAHHAIHAINGLANSSARKGGLCDMIRDVFGNPFRTGAFELGWRTTTVTALAKSIYEDHTFDHLPILADALEDAGCTNRDILDHCRQPGEHARGCWVVDLVLGKE